MNARAVPLLALLLTLACGQAPLEPASSGDEAPVAEASPRPEPLDFRAAPPGAAVITSLLGARHTADLPGEETLQTHPEPAASLRWIAANHPRLVIRGRALTSLRFFDDATTRALLEATLRDVDAHATLRAAAATGTESLALDEPLRDALERARASSDPRVTRAVDRRLARAPGDAPTSPLAD